MVTLHYPVTRSSEESSGVEPGLSIGSERHGECLAQEDNTKIMVSHEPKPLASFAPHTLLPSSPTAVFSHP